MNDIDIIIINFTLLGVILGLLIGFLIAMNWYRKQLIKLRKEILGENE